MKNTKNAKFHLFALLLVALLVAIAPTTAFADMGPKPYVTVNVKGVASDCVYYVTLLSKDAWSGPHGAWSFDNDYDLPVPMPDATEEDAVFYKFVNYIDTDGYYFLQVMERMQGEDTFTWGYYPPDDFKVLLYFVQEDLFMVSEIYQTYAFASIYDVHYQGTPDLSVKQNYDFGEELLGFSLRLLFTIGIEIALALLFGYRKTGQLLLIAITNAVTQLALNIVLWVILYQSGSLSFVFAYVIGEFFVFLVEAIVYAIVINKVSNKSKPVQKVLKVILYAIVANLISLGVGLFASWLTWIIAG